MLCYNITYFLSILLFSLRACDTCQLINDGNPHPEIDLENYDKNIIVGNKSIKPRLTKVPTIMPLSKKKHYVSIYELHKINLEIKLMNIQRISLF